MVDLIMVGLFVFVGGLVVAATIYEAGEKL